MISIRSTAIPPTLKVSGRREATVYCRQKTTTQTFDSPNDVPPQSIAPIETKSWAGAS